MEIRAGATAMVAWALAVSAGAEGIRRIETIEGSQGRGGSIYVMDWNGDGAVELIREDFVGEDDVAGALLDMKLTQIYEADGGKWLATHAFVHRVPWESQFHPKTSYEDRKMSAIHRLDGDFTGDGIPDTIVLEHQSTPVPGKESPPLYLRVRQEGKVLFEEMLCTAPDFEAAIYRLEALDPDRDGVLEIFAAITDGQRGVDNAFVYGTEKSQWRGDNPFDIPVELRDVLQFVKGVRAAHPETTSPVMANLSSVSATKGPAGETGEQPTTYRFRVDFAAATGNEGPDLAAWRDYFAKWGIIYAYGEVGNFSELPATPSVVRIRDAAFDSDGDSLVFETDFPLGYTHFAPGGYELWLECPYVERDPNPFGWFGTLRTPILKIEIADWWPGDDDKQVEAR